MKVVTAVASALVLLAATERAAAAEEPRARDAAAAEVLFDEARVLMQGGRFAEACTKLEASQRLDAGVGTLLNLGDCYEKAGRRATAWARFREAASAAALAGQVEREREARARAAALEPTLPKLVVVPDRSTNVLTIRRDDVVLESELWGTALPIDAGDHILVATAPEHRPWTIRFRVTSADDGTTRTITVPRLLLEPKPAPERPSDSSPRRTVGFVLGGIGLGALAGSGLLALRASSLYEDASSRCLPSGCSAAARDDARTAGRLADLATASVVAGGVLLASAIVLFVTAPSHHDRAALVTRVFSDRAP